MPKSAKYLLIGSLEAYSGKSAIILGIAHQLKTKGLDIAYGKPLSGGWGQTQMADSDGDIQFVAQTLDLPKNRLQPSILTLDAETIKSRLSLGDQPDYRQKLAEQRLDQGGELVLLEGPGTIEEGKLFNLSLIEVAETMQASVLLVARFHSMLLLDGLLTAKETLGDQLLGVCINDVPSDQLETVNSLMVPFLEKRGVVVFGVLPRSALLRSVSVAELVHQLKAEVLCRPDRLDLMVESLTIGAMNVNSALKYFRARRNMAVVTGGDRTDLQFAALETSTQCLILTGHIPPSKEIISRAEDLEIPILSVDLDTLSTVEIIDRAFGQVRLHEPIKFQCICQMIEEHLDSDRLLSSLGLAPAGALP
ncbi:DRTGG domain-containing protein [Myxacorys almedinensis]|uniref:AAA family ATPase n=1 Tax=Myxacorys almedinensis A TaxID=2690445 RepID=A0A8J8CHG6_9CYAN|nr:AAA family ATPase [Myxacorys almedinensis A]